MRPHRRKNPPQPIPIENAGKNPAFFRLFPFSRVLFTNARKKTKTMKNHTPECLKELEELVDSCREPLFRFAFFRLGSRMDAEDVVQDAFLKWASRPERTVGHPRAYLFRMVSNGCCDRRRRRTPLAPKNAKLTKKPDESKHSSTSSRPNRPRRSACTPTRRSASRRSPRCSDVRSRPSNPASAAASKN